MPSSRPRPSSPPVEQLYRPQEILTGGHGWPASRAGVASRGAWAMVAVPITTGRTPAELRAMARRERDGRVSARLLALPTALDGTSRDQAARAACMDRPTL